jgi:DNA-binding PucR family transcriptional regulator
MEQAGGWPHAKLALIGADPRMLTHLSSGGFGTAVPVADNLNAALAMTDRPPRPARTTSTYGALGAYPSRVDAIAQTNPEAAQFVQDWLGVVIEHDLLGRSELVATLASFLQHNCDYNATARAMGIHRSTARYRIHRIVQLTQLDIRDPETCRHLYAATRIFGRLSDTP